MPIRDSKRSRNAYYRDYMLARYKRRYQEAIDNLGGICIRCGSSEDLQFDHKNPETKSFSIGKSIVSISRARLEAELVKCQLLCGECHKKKTLLDLGLDDPKTIHGTLSSYRYCRCKLCCAAKVRYNKERAKRKSHGV